MWLVIVVFLAFIVLFTLMIYLTNRWISAFMQRHIGGRLEAIDQIVNEERVPDAWLEPYRSRAAKLRTSGATDEHIAGLAGIARKKCLANIQELIRYAEGTRFTDNEATKRFMLAELRRQEASWHDDAVWRQWVKDW